MALALDEAKPIFADVWVLRSIGHEALFRQFHSEAMIVTFVGLRTGGIGSAPFQPMLANHHRTLLGRPEIFRDKQNAVGKNVRPDIQHHLVPAKLWIIVNQPCARICRQAGGRQPPDHFVPNVVTVKTRGLVPSFRR